MPRDPLLLRYPAFAAEVRARVEQCAPETAGFSAPEQIAEARELLLDAAAHLFRAFVRLEALEAAAAATAADPLKPPADWIDALLALAKEPRR